MIRCLADSFANKKESGNRIRNIDDGYRYGALNLNALWKHGTVEFRMLEMEYSASKLLRWVNIILSILKYSAETPKNKILKVTTVYSDKCETYIKNVFGKYAEFLMYKGYERDIMLGSRVARDMIYTPALAKVGAWDLLEAGMYDGVRTTINMGHPSLIVGHDPSVDMTYQVPPLFANMLIDDEEIIDEDEEIIDDEF